MVIKTLDPELDPDPDPLNADPQPWLLVPFRTVLLDIKEGFPMALAIPSDFMWITELKAKTDRFSLINVHSSGERASVVTDNGKVRKVR